ncbi:unnamed protein product, partial [Brassica oleracea]
LDLFSVRFGFGSVRIVNVGTGKYPEKVWFSFGSGSGSDSSGSSDNLDKILIDVFSERTYMFSIRMVMCNVP